MTTNLLFQNHRHLALILIFIAATLGSTNCMSTRSRIVNEQPQQLPDLFTQLPVLPKNFDRPVVVDIYIDANGQVSMNDVPYDDTRREEFPQLREKLLMMMEVVPNLPVIIMPSPEAPRQRVEEVIKMCRDAGVSHIFKYPDL